jgi:hypothetical protein
MCTLTWWQQSAEYTLFFNRDEQKSRRAALPPKIFATESGTRYIAPSDGNFGGTWLLVNEFGLTLGLLNHYAATQPYEPANPTSRGALPLMLAHCPNVVELGQCLAQLSLETFRPFHLIAIDAENPLAQWTWHGGTRLLEHDRSPSPPITTSSFESAAVCAKRRERFLAIDPSTLPEALGDYHLSTDPGDSAFSVRMRRTDAQTVSTSRVTVNTREIVFSYRPETIDSLEMAPPVSLRMKRAPAPSL